LVDVPADGATIGEVVVRGNTVMAGYYRNPEATAKAFAGGWLHTGDLGVMHADGYVELKDRAKDIIISGGDPCAYACRTRTANRPTALNCRRFRRSERSRRPAGRPR
ncbi:hypothetical protein CJ199_13295, partial [Brevibacterium paucivorans]